MILSNLNSIFRYLRKNGIYTTLNVLGLAFGFGCAILILLHVFKEKSYNSSIPDHDRIYNLVMKTPDSQLGNTFISYALSPMLAKNFPEIEGFARTENYSWYSNCNVSYHRDDNGELLSFNEKDFYLADSDFFQIISYPFIEGSPKTALKKPNSIVLSKETANKYFGNSPALGKTLIFNNDKSYIVSGVVKIPRYVTLNFSMLAPITSLRSADYLNGWDINGDPYFKLNKNVNYKEFNKKIEHFSSKINPDIIRNPEQITLALIPITERVLYYNQDRLFLLILIGIAVLIISVLNYIIMSTSMVKKRRSEVAMKKISGAGVSNIARQFMLETSIITFFAILLGIMLAITAMPLFKKLVNSDVQPFFDAHIILFLTGCTILWVITTILAGFYPAIVLSRTKPLVLLDKKEKTSSGAIGKNILVTFQFIISIILVVLTMMINRQYKHVANVPLGFDNKMVVQIPFSNTLKESYSVLKDELKKIPSVKEVCAASSMPAGIPNNSGVSWTDYKGNKQDESFCFAIVSDGYTQTFGMNIAMGHRFERNEPEELKGVIINETAVKHLGYENPIGKQLHFWGKDNPVIGVVSDFQNNFLFNKTKPMIISAHPENQKFTKYLYVSILPRNTENTIKEIKNTIKQISPDFPFEYSFTNAEVQDYFNGIKEMNSSFRFASFISILLALIGLVALTYHATQARIKEIGIRKVNGARNIEIISLLNNSLMKSVLIAFIIASPIAWTIVVNMLKEFENKATIAWWIFVLAGLIIGGIALLTVSFQSWRAASRNPVEALRYE